MITPPIPDPNRSVIRAVLEAGAQFTPVTAALARIYQTTHPSSFERDLVEWREDVSQATNGHEVRLASLEEKHHPKLRLSEHAQSLAVFLVRESEKGLSDPVAFEKIQAALPNLSKRELEDAAAELKLVGLAEVSGALGHPVLRVRPAYPLFALLDPVIMGTSPLTDAVSLARLALELDSGHVPDLEARLSWSKRRLNPALALIIELVAEGRVRKVIQPDYVTLGFMLEAEERVRFRRLIEAAPSEKLTARH